MKKWLARLTLVVLAIGSNGLAMNDYGGGGGVYIKRTPDEIEQLLQAHGEAAQAARPTLHAVSGPGPEGYGVAISWSQAHGVPTASEQATRYGNSWRIAQVESLFAYAMGTDTATFTNLSFPSRYVSVSTLTQAEYDTARQICQGAGVTDPALFEDCILDVAVTGDTTFAQSAREDTPSVSTFGTDKESWTHVGDPATFISHQVVGGNPGGHIRLHEAGQVAGVIDGFVAPVKFRGNLSGYYGGTLSYDLRVNTISPRLATPVDDVILVGGGLTLYYSTPEPAEAGVWETFTVGLDADAGWRVNSATGSLATATQIQSVLANLTVLRIRANYRGGIELVDLDNVILNVATQQ